MIKNKITKDFKVRINTPKTRRKYTKQIYKKQIFSAENYKHL